MGVVWEARQLSLNRRVALKVLHPHLGLSGRFFERFQREAQAGGRLEHSGIVTVFGVGEADGMHFIVQELIADGLTFFIWTSATPATTHFGRQALLPNQAVDPKWQASLRCSVRAVAPRRAPVVDLPR
ncbi:MAG: hypothetical protein GY747_02720 [Planctomycetes bacterium]|nr:hypothetical protein [Planctomycetota bacterium]MCP4860666.1 hypothetical protein [Planctomycetota bacterium]